MAEALIPNLFKNATEGECSAPIVGHGVPKYVKGVALYNGPVGLWDLEHGSARQWFDGLAILQGFTLDPKSKMVHFRKRFLKSDAFQKATKHGKLISTEFGTPGCTDPDKGILSRMVDFIVPGEMTDNCACSFYRLGGLVVATTETCLLRVVDPDTLETGQKVDMSSLVNVMSARGLTDEASGDLYNLACTFTTGLKYHFIRFPASDSVELPSVAKSGEIVATIPSRMMTCFSYYHSFAMSDHYLLMIEQPLVANSAKLLASRLAGLSFRECLEWHPEARNLFHLIEKSTGALLNEVIYKSEQPFYFLNLINMFEDDKGNAIIDLIGYESPELYEHTELNKLRSCKAELKDESQIIRFILPVIKDVDKANREELQERCRQAKFGQASATLEETRSSTPIIRLKHHLVIYERGCEHPIINPRYRGKRYNFCYVVGWLHSLKISSIFSHAVTKIDLISGGAVAAWDGGDFCYPSEAVFIPDPDGRNEDDGVVVSAVTDVRDAEKDFIVFLDARNMNELGRASFDETIPFTSHGFFLSQN